MLLMNLIIKALCLIFPYKELGWKHIGETFYRWTLLSLRGYRVYLHYLDAKIWHTHCHDHPWDFTAIVLGDGYFEDFRGKRKWYGPLCILRRPAKSLHNVQTPSYNWSIVITGPKKRGWGFHTCSV